MTWRLSDGSTMKNGDWPMEERRATAEIVNRATRLAMVHAEPVRLRASDGGSRVFVVGRWKFEVQRHTTVYYSSRFVLGQTKRVQVWNVQPGASGRVLVFVYNIENPPYQNSEGKPWSMHLPTCRDVLLSELRQIMLLDDLAECG